jgi:hypothetical protein
MHETAASFPMEPTLIEAWFSGPTSQASTAVTIQNEAGTITPCPSS